MANATDGDTDEEDEGAEEDAPIPLDRAPSDRAPSASEVRDQVRDPGDPRCAPLPAVHWQAGARVAPGPCACMVRLVLASYSSNDE